MSTCVQHHCDSVDSRQYFSKADLTLSVPFVIISLQSHCYGFIVRVVLCPHDQTFNFNWMFDISIWPS